MDAHVKLSAYLYKYEQAAWKEVIEKKNLPIHVLFTDLY